VQPNDPANQRLEDTPPDPPEEMTTPPPAVAEEEGPTRMGWRRTLAAAYRRARTGAGPRRTEVNTRGEKNLDRSKTFMLLAATVVIAGFAFLVLFSTPGIEKRAQQRRTKPSLGRPDVVTGQAGQGAGSVAPLLSADPATGEPSADVSPKTSSRRPDRGSRDLNKPQARSHSRALPFRLIALSPRRQSNRRLSPPLRFV
jgi:hypothetical protein